MQQMICDPIEVLRGLARFFHCRNNRPQLFVSLAFLFLVLLPAYEARGELGREMNRQEKAKLNENRVGIMGGGPGGTYIKLVNDLSILLDDPENLEMRVIGMIGKGSVQNIEDLLSLQKVDFAVVQSDVLRDMAQRSGYPNIKSKIGYVTKLYEEEIHVLARRDIRVIDDLQGKRVNIGAPGSGHRLTADIVFQFLGIDVSEVGESAESALAALVAGEIDAMVYVGGKPLDLFRQLSSSEVDEAGLHFLDIPDNPLLAAEYERAEMVSADYPSIILPRETINTMSVSAVLAVYWWPEGHARYTSTSRFVERFFARFEELNQPGYTDKWREVDLGADLAAWNRYPPAEQWLEQYANAPQSTQGGVDRCITEFFKEIEGLGLNVEDLSEEASQRALARFAVNNPDICG